MAQEPQNVVIWGAGGHALVVADILRCQVGWHVAGFIDDANPRRAGEAFCGSTVLGGRDLLPTLRDRGVTHAILAFGNCAARLELADVVTAAGLELATAIHPNAVVAADVSIGPGSQVVAGAVINPASRIGANVIINTCASVDHECVIADGAHVCPGVRLGGAVKVGRGAWVGIGSTVLPKVSIGDGATIGAGAVVLEDVPPNVTAFGVPAKIQTKP